MSSGIRQIIRNLRSRRFLRRWARCRDGDVEGKYYIKRMFEDNVSYYDLYWHIKSKAGDKHVDTLYLRAGENFLIYIIKNAEKTELPLLLEKIHGRETEKEDTGGPHADRSSR